MSKNEKIEDVLTRGVEEIIHKKDLEQKLRSGKKLRVKLGIDPTSPNIHIGRAVVLWKLRAFQELGHKVIFIVGDFTGLIGDTSDKDAERPMLSEEQVKLNMKSYFDQAFKILDKDKTETYRNSKWLKKLGFAEIGKMADAFSLHEFSSRENIAKRLKAGKRVSLRELLYPLMQGYDSVAVKADIELGGTDQRFNLLAGRTIQPLYGQNSQNILTMTLLEGTDGRKMSSSWGNVVNLTDSPKDMFGKIMSIPDNLVEKYFLMTTSLSVKDIKSILKQHHNPRDQKLILAETITATYHNKKQASLAKEDFINQFSKKQLPSDIPELKLKKGVYSIIDILVKQKVVESKSEVRRLIKQNGIKIQGRAIKSEDINLNQQPITIQIGKRRFLKLIS